MTDSVHPNLLILQKLDIRNLDSCADIIADNFVWHYYNPKLPELQGDYKGVRELKEFFGKLASMSGDSFGVTVVDSRAVGDELVVTQTCNHITFEGRAIEFDVIVVWRFIEGKIAEAWDIPSVYHVRDVN